MEVYGCSVDIFQFFGPKMGLKPGQGRPVQCFQHKKSLIYLILTTFGDEITFGHIAQ